MIQFRPFSSGQESKIPDLDEPSGKDMLEEPSDEFLSRERTGSEFIIFSILVPEGYMTVLNVQNVSVRNGYSEDIGCQILQCSLARPDGFDMAHPFLSPD